MWVSVTHRVGSSDNARSSMPGRVELAYQWPDDPQVFRVVGYRSYAFGPFSYTQQIFAYTDSTGVKPGRLLRIVFPLWLPMILLLIYPTIRLCLGPVRQGFRMRRGRCGRCGYDLRANTTNTCPECGQVVPGRFRTPADAVEDPSNRNNQSYG